MALTKNYAILELQNILLNVETKAVENETEEDLYLEVAKEIYPQLEQIFRLVFEPVFNNEPTLEEEVIAVAEADALRENVDRLREELVKLGLVNEGLHVNFKEHLDRAKEERNWLRMLVERNNNVNRPVITKGQ